MSEPKLPDSVSIQTSQKVQLGTNTNLMQYVLAKPSPVGTVKSVRSPADTCSWAPAATVKIKHDSYPSSFVQVKMKYYKCPTGALQKEKKNLYSPFCSVLVLLQLPVISPVHFQSFCALRILFDRHKTAVANQKLQWSRAI